jgi:hypothetical protein
MEIPVAFDQPMFTVVHQVSHVWLSPSLIEARWIREGLASLAAGSVGAEIDLEPPFEPVAEAEAHADAAFLLDDWPPDADPEAEAYGNAASWALAAEIERQVGPDAMRTVLARVSASVGAYDGAEIDPAPGPDAVDPPVVPLTTRSFLDQLETVSDADLAELFRSRALTEADAALLEPRAGARAAFDELIIAADGWGAPDSVRADMSEWNFDEAMVEIEAAMAWLERRDELLAAMADAGLAAPDRLQQAYLAYSGGPEAGDELEAERAVVDAYVEAADVVNAERSLLARIGMAAGADPEAQLGLANGRFADGDLRGALEATDEAQRIVAGAETGGLVRLASLGLLVAIGAGLALALFRRRASYTARR